MRIDERKKKKLSLFLDRKGMGVEQVFIFIVVAVTFTLITIFGYKAIGDFLNKGEQVQFVQFKNDLESAVKRIYTQYGSTQIEEFNLPSRYEQICFVNMDRTPTSEEMEELCSYDQLACTVWQLAQQAQQEGNSGYASVDENVFLQPTGPVPIKVFVIMIDDQGNAGFLCEKITKGQFALRLEGKGSYTQIARSE